MMTVDRTRAEAIVYEVLKEAHLTAMFDELSFAQEIIEALEKGGRLAHEKEPTNYWRLVTQEGKHIAESEYESVCRYWQDESKDDILQRRWADKHSYEWRDEQ